MILSQKLYQGLIVGVDTAPLIYLVEKHPLYFNKMMVVMQALVARKITAISTMLTLTEVLTHPLRQGNMALVKQYDAILQHSKSFQLMPLDASIARKAAELRAIYHLHTPDAIQIATCIQTGCDAFLTNDRGLKR